MIIHCGIPVTQKSCVLLLLCMSVWAGDVVSRVSLAEGVVTSTGANMSLWLPLLLWSRVLYQIIALDARAARPNALPDDLVCDVTASSVATGDGAAVIAPPCFKAVVKLNATSV